MKTSPEVSVIIPVYNRAHTVACAIDSVLSQTYQNYEVLLVDDGSKDDSRKVILSYSDPRIKLFEHAENRGAAAARNTGIRQAQGKYIAFLDSDDEWLPAKLDEQIACLNSAPENVGGCITGKFNIESGQTTQHIPQKRNSWRETLLYVCDLGPGSTLMIARKVFGVVGFLDETLKRYEDWDWLVRFTRAYDLCLIKKTLVRVNRSVYQNPEKIEEAGNILLEKHQQDFKGYGWLKTKKICSRRLQDIAWHYSRAYENGSCREYLLKSRQYYFKTICTFPFQRPGVYLALFDSIFGTSLRLWFSKNVWRFFRNE